MSTVRPVFTEEVDGKISGSGGECDNPSAGTLSLPEMCLKSVINIAMSNRCLVCRGDLSVLQEVVKSVVCGQ